MKKFGIIILALVLCMTVCTGCGEKAGDPPGTTTTVFDPLVLAKQIPEAVQIEMKDAYLAKYGRDLIEKDSPEYEYMHFRAYGIFGDAYAVYVEGPFGYATVEWGESVNGQLLFKTGDTQKMYVYRDGQFYTLQEAYDHQIVTWDDLMVIQANYLSENPVFSPDAP